MMEACVAVSMGVYCAFVPKKERATKNRKRVLIGRRDKKEEGKDSDLAVGGEEMGAEKREESSSRFSHSVEKKKKHLIYSCS